MNPKRQKQRHQRGVTTTTKTKRIAKKKEAWITRECRHLRRFQVAKGEQKEEEERGDRERCWQIRIGLKGEHHVTHRRHRNTSYHLGVPELHLGDLLPQLGNQFDAVRQRKA